MKICDAHVHLGESGPWQPYMGENRILFGSDTPYLRYQTQIAIIEAANISQKVKRKIFRENFIKLFGEKC